MSSRIVDGRLNAVTAGRPCNDYQTDLQIDNNRISIVVCHGTQKQVFSTRVFARDRAFDSTACELPGDVCVFYGPSECAMLDAMLKGVAWTG